MRQGRGWDQAGKGLKAMLESSIALVGTQEDFKRFEWGSLVSTIRKLSLDFPLNVDRAEPPTEDVSVSYGALSHLFPECLNLGGCG